MTLIERTIRAQKERLKKVNNERFTIGDMEYRISYDGGVAEYISVYGRKGNKPFHYIDGFFGFKLNNAEEIIAKAKDLAYKKYSNF